MTFIWLAAGLIAGLLARRFKWVSVSAPTKINTFIINVALPAMILLKVPALELSTTALAPVAASWLVVITSAGLLWLLAKLNNWPASTLGALLLVVPLTNSAYLGIPLLDAFTDDTVVAYGAIYDQFGNFLALSIYAPLVIGIVGNRGRDASKTIPLAAQLLGIVRKVFSFTPFPVLLVAVLFMSASTLPDWARSPLTWLALTMGPLAAFIIGYSSRLTAPADLRGPLIIGLTLNLLVSPLVVWLAMQLFSVSGPAATASILQAAMPCMITAGLIGISAGYSERLIMAMLSLTTLFSVVTLTGLFLIL